MKPLVPFMAAVALLASPALADGIQPGLRKITTTAVNNGERLPPHINARCLTAKQANELADMFSPRFGGVNTECKRTQYEKTDQKLSWRLECRGQVLTAGSTDQCNTACCLSAKFSN